MNTTKLISQWSMQGAGRGIDGRFRKTDDILEILASNRAGLAPAVSPTLQVRGSDEDDWKSLGVGGEGHGGRVW